MNYDLPVQDSILLLSLHLEASMPWCFSRLRMETYQAPKPLGALDQFSPAGLLPAPVPIRSQHAQLWGLPVCCPWGGGGHIAAAKIWATLLNKSCRCSLKGDLLLILQACLCGKGPSSASEKGRANERLSWAVPGLFKGLLFQPDRKEPLFWISPFRMQE